ncbi:hypothetical protein AX16_009755 [Volvariella volvacea WC 439]|nr:hypothetical protein AX16_009755 [Volvariella volvacea WC 439]
MATRRRIGVSAASTEAARRQLMQPVTCWEKVWTAPENMPTSSSLKVYKWVKTEKVQQFSDDEGGVDEPLAPLPDEPEVQEGDDEMDQDEPADTETQTAGREATQDAASKAPSPKPSRLIQEGDISQNADLGEDEGGKLGTASLSLDISSLGPDGLQLESAQNLSQIDEADALMGGTIMDATLDSFTPSTK